MFLVHQSSTKRNESTRAPADWRACVLLVQGDHVYRIEFGSAEKLDAKDPEPVVVTFTSLFAHPQLRERKISSSSSNRVRGTLKRSDIDAKFDYYALGKSILFLLASIDQKYRHDSRQTPLFNSLHFIATKLFDGENETVSPAAHFLEETFLEQSKTDYETISYTSLKDVLDDLDKETGKWSPESNVGELSTYSQQTTRIVPDETAVLTPRLRAVIKHPMFARLKLVSQLGLISLRRLASASRLSRGNLAR
jgi:hypothetical protein